MRILIPILTVLLAAGCPASRTPDGDGGVVGPDGREPVDVAPVGDAGVGAPRSDSGPRIEPPPGAVVCGGSTCSTGEVCCLLDSRCIVPGDPDCALPPGTTDPRACVVAEDCDPGEVCLEPGAPVPGLCAGFVGSCIAAPSPDDCAPSSQDVCGCDGRTYASTCAAFVAGTRVAALAACGAEDQPNLGQSCASDADCEASGWLHAHCDVAAGHCLRDGPMIFCGIDEQCPTGEACCGITGRCYDPEHPALCSPPPEGTEFPCETQEDCDRWSGAYWTSFPLRSYFCDGPGCAGPGGCRLRGVSCDGVLAPVCGCDGLTYTNECEADNAGVRVASSGPC